MLTEYPDLLCAEDVVKILGVSRQYVYREALSVAPQKVKEFLKEIFSKPEKQEQNRWDISIQKPKPKKKDDFER